MPTLDPNNLSTSMGRWDIEIDNEGDELVIHVSESSGRRLVVDTNTGAMSSTPRICVYVDEA